MISWEGGFGWQSYALTGRPDFLNYLHTGDVTWGQLWDFYRKQTVHPEAVRALVRLFHILRSSEYDGVGCWLDPEGEIRMSLRAWVEFVLDNEEKAPLAEIQADLAGLVGSGLVTPLYYQAAYVVFMEASVEREATRWQLGAYPGSDAECVEFPEPHDRHLPVYHPSTGQFPQLIGNASWKAFLRSHVAVQYTGWNTAYAAGLPDPDHEDAWTMVGGEG